MEKSGRSASTMAAVGPLTGEGTPTSPVAESAEDWQKRRLYPKPGSTGQEDPDAVHQGTDGLSIRAFVSWMNHKGLKGLEEDFVFLGMSELSDDERKDKSAFKLPENLAKNRHKDITLLEETRVKLEDGLGSDYIHASYVDGHKQKKAYIATQAPMEKTLVDFWRMIWQERVVSVVMVTRMNEGAEKATPYWPLRKTGRIRFGPFVVTNKDVSQRSTYILTELVVLDLRTDESRRLNHLYYLDWPDHCVPIFIEGFLHFMERMRQLQAIHEGKAGGGSPIVVHCSAGIGRTGTFIAADICFRGVVDTGRLDVAAVVKRLRKHRAGSVQSATQFIFLHVVLLYMLKGEALIDPATVDSLALSNGYN